MNRASGSTCSRSPGRQKNRQRSSKPSGAPVELLGDLAAGPPERQEVGERAVGPLDREPQHLAAQRREDDRHRLGRRLLELEAGRGPLAGERGVAGSRASRRSCVSGFENGISFQPSTIRSDEAPIPSANRPPLRVGERRGLLGEQRRPAREHADHAGAEPRPLGPGRGQRQRGEAVGPVGLAAPEVGVAGRLGAPDEVGVVAQRQFGQRQRQAPAFASLATLSASHWRRTRMTYRLRYRLARDGLLAPDRNRVLVGGDRRRSLLIVSLLFLPWYSLEHTVRTPGNAELRPERVHLRHGRLQLHRLRHLPDPALAPARRRARAADPRLDPRPRPQALLGARRDDDGRRLHR